MAKAKPEPDYPYIDVEVTVANSNRKPTTEIRSKPDFTQDPRTKQKSTLGTIIMTRPEATLCYTSTPFTVGIGVKSAPENALFIA